jgi:hypothetical protein
LKASGYNPVPSISIPTDFLSSISFANPINTNFTSTASVFAAAVETVEGCVTE